MKKRRLILKVFLILCAIGATAYFWKKYCSPTHIAFVNYQALQLGEIARANDNLMIEVSDLQLDNIDKIDDYDMVFVNGMGLRLTAEQRSAIEVAGLCGVPILTVSSTNPDNYIVSLSETDADTIVDYLSGGRRNIRSMLNYIRTYIDKKKIFCGEIEPVVERKNYMITHTDMEDADSEDVGFNSIREYLEYMTEHLDPNYGNRKAIVVTGQMGDAADLSAALEAKGLAVYYLQSLQSAINRHTIDSIAPRAVVNMAHGRLGDGVVEYLTKSNIPLFCPLNVNTLDTEWQSDKMGMSGGFLSQSVVMPEIDGALRPYSLFAQRINGDIREAYTMPHRLSDFVETICNYLSLKEKANKDKRVAIVYFKGPGQAALAASGMEVVPSLYNLLVKMRREGYNVDGLPSTAAELERQIQAQGEVFSTYDDADFEHFMQNGNPELIDKEQYTSWVKKSLTDEAYNEVVSQFGEFPGEYMSTADGRLGVARLQFGNVVLMPQPLAGKGDNAFAIVHGTDAAPSHVFIAPYLWARYGFGADVLVHFGTHGGLEYTPRKQVALSDSDWPDRLVGNMPHLYIYTISNVGEALIAKRRSYAGIQSHLTAPFLESGLRQQYKKLDDAIANYNKNVDSKNVSTTKSASLLVKKIAVELGIASELQLDTTDLSVPYSEDEISKIESFAEEIANEKIVGQLYTLGEAYEPDRIESSVKAMATEPVAYGLLALDKQLGRAKYDTEKHKSLFTRKYLEPAQRLVAEIYKNQSVTTDEFICKTAGITMAQLLRAREVTDALSRPRDQMSMMMNMQKKMQQATDTARKAPMEMPGNKKDTTTANNQPDSAKMAGMRAMGENTDPRKALQMAKMMGASDESLKKMAAAMGVTNAKPKSDGLSDMMNMMAAQKQDFSLEERNLATAICEVERALKNIGKYRQQLLESPVAELNSMMNAMNGGYTPPSPGGDIICNANVLPTGRNMFGINAEATPSEVAWEKGKALANATLEQYRASHNDSLPRKVSYTLWSGEFVETEGATIAQILYMLGVEPVRDAFGRVTDLRLIPSEDLGRERIDVVVQTSGQLRDLAASRLFLITRAVEMAANAADDKFENQVAEGVLEAERTLTAKGLSPKEARQLSTRRVFGGVNGNYGTGIQQMVQQGDKWQDVSEIADVYMNNMGAYYGSEDEWESHSKLAFEAALTRADAVVQPRQSNTWGALSLDHVYEFMGGMNLAIKTVTGKDPDAYLADYRNRNNARLQPLKEAVGVESRATILNPVYIGEKMKGGSSAAASFAEVIENTYGWNVMKPEVIDERLWNDIYDVYINDKYDLGISEFFEAKSPAALQQMTSVMKQAIDKGLWNATEVQSERIERIEQINAQMQKLTQPQTVSNAQNDGTVLKKERLDTAESQTTYVSTGAVAGVVIVAILLIIIIVRKRRKETDED
ncbi:MAG: cobaltochelatase subunit CobN [Bacteroidales bacterium]|nr:cobaltochelatase subunit CobN [Bacteroidales bacterium]